jgi:hypothetical protein
MNMSQTLFLLFNHKFTPLQEREAAAVLGVTSVVTLPAGLQDLWSDIPPDLEKLSGYLEPVRQWLLSHASKDDFVLVQGDFGACYLMVSFAMERGLIPVYSTTQRKAVEECLPDGSVMLTHQFQHRIFRRYGV